jgi:alpha-L-fucosidase
MKKYLTGILFILLPVLADSQSLQDEGVPFAPPQNRRPADYKLSDYKYSLEGLKINFSEDMMKKATRQYKMVMDVNGKGKWKPLPESFDNHQTPEWFRDAKFGMFIDWGLWSVAGWAEKREGKAMYPDWYEYRLDTDSTFIKYHAKNWGADFKRDDFIPLFTASKYDPARLAKTAREAGMKYIIPFCKHHSGFCLWPSGFTQRDAGDMGPGRDLIQPMVESCKKEGLKFGFYFSLEEWEYPLINENGDLVMKLWTGGMAPYLGGYEKEYEKKATGKIAVRNFSKDYILPQATEFIDRYDPDILWYDGEWNTSVYDLLSYDIAAYFYNRAEGRKEVAVNDRLGIEKDGKWLRFRRGDIFTSEYHDQDDSVKSHAWEENRGISQSFGYNWQDTEANVITPKAFIDMFADIVANGGNLLLIVNLDGKGAMPAVQENRLKEIGKWLKVNGEGIYSTRTWSTVSEDDVVYTCSKDKKYVYAIMKKWPGRILNLKNSGAGKGCNVSLLGYDSALQWSTADGLLEVKFPDELMEENKRPCDYAWVLKIKI